MRLIDADELNEKIINYIVDGYANDSEDCTEFVKMIKEAPTISLEDILKEKKVLKEVTAKYVIYDRDFLAENLDREVELIKSYKEWKHKINMRQIDFSKEWKENAMEQDAE